jgi:hypothetical protein
LPFVAFFGGKIPSPEPCTSRSLYSGRALDAVVGPQNILRRNQMMEILSGSGDDYDVDD